MEENINVTLLRTQINNRLSELKEKYLLLMNSSPQGIAFIKFLDENHESFIFTEVNISFEKIFQTKGKALIGKKFGLSSKEGIMKYLDVIFLLNSEPNNSKIIKIEDREYILANVIYNKGNDLGILFSDVTEKLNKAICLRNFDLIKKFSGDILMFIRVSDGKIVEVSDSAEGVYGFSREELLDKTIFELRASDDSSIVRIQLAQSFKKGLYYEALHFKKDKTFFYAEENNRGIEDIKEPHIISIIRDISETKRSASNNIDGLNYDVISGLPGRKNFISQLIKEISRGKRTKKKFALMIIVIDNFRNINNSLGHNIGDIVIREVSLRIKKSVRNEDTAAKSGVNEFALIQTMVNSKEDIKVFANKIMKKFEKPFISGENSMYISVSIGISIYPDDGIDDESLLKHADIAMTNAKVRGGNCFEFYTTSMSEEALESLMEHNKFLRQIKKHR